MSREVRLVVGEGDDKHEIGIARINPIENGSAMVEITVTDAKMAMLLGGNQIKGIIPRVISTLSDNQDQEEDHESRE